MATLFLVLALALAASALSSPPSSRNTIFIDEQLEGQIFEVRPSEAITDLATRNTSNYRLPTTTRPVHYDVIWVIDMDLMTFSGSVEITLVATQANVEEIVLHSKELEISSVTLREANITVGTPTNYELNPELQFLTVRPTSPLQYDANTTIEYILTINFGAELRRDMSGIYRSWYRNAWNETTRWMATTQFQSTSSRSAFPCYDEPSFKATFSIRIRRPSSFESWSCTRKETVNQNVTLGYDEDVYTITPIMSTYLIALIVAEYESKPLFENNELIYEVIARPGAMEFNQSDYAYDVGLQLLDVMSELTAFDFFDQSPNLKMTQASIPDFSAGAMENWGLLTYREAYIMYDPEHSNDYDKQIIAYILSHEITHMWFGNLVTCDWWGDTWLNEGFARFYQYYLTHRVEPEMGFDIRFITEQVHSAMLTDSGNSPHPLSNPNVGSPAEVGSMFSTISYNKGAAIIRMTEHLLGADVHTQGLRNYLVDNSYKTVLPNDLSEALHNVSVATGAISEYGPDFSVVEYYKTWHDQGGVPVIYVDVNHNTGDMTITQRRFNINTGYSSTNYNWQIPITFTTANNTDFDNLKPSHVLTATVTVINRGSQGDEWVIFNKQQTGYYRVNYDDYTWNLIILALRGDDRTRIHEFNRAQIVNDVFQFARSGLMTYTRALNILSFLQYERHYAPWVAAITGFNWIRNRLAGNPLLATLESQIIQWATPLMNELEYTPIEGESFMRSYLRRQMAPFMCNLGAEACRTSASSQFRSLIDNGEEVPVNSRNWVYCNGLRASNDYNDYAIMWRRFIEHNVYTEKIQLLQTLGCTPLETALNELLTSLVEDNQEIRPQDYSNTFSTALAGNEGNTQIVFNFIKLNLTATANAFGSVSSPLQSVAARLRTNEEIDEFQIWLNQTQATLGSAYTDIYRASESTRESIAFGLQIQDDLENYLTNGDDNINSSTLAPEPTTNPTTVPVPDITAPPTPDLPDSAITAAVSYLVITFAAIITVIL